MLLREEAQLEPLLGGCRTEEKAKTFLHLATGIM